MCDSLWGGVGWGFSELLRQPRLLEFNTVIEMAAETPPRHFAIQPTPPQGKCDFSCNVRFEFLDDKRDASAFFSPIYPNLHIPAFLPCFCKWNQHHFFGNIVYFHICRKSFRPVPISRQGVVVVRYAVFIAFKIADGVDAADLLVQAFIDRQSPAGRPLF